MPAVQKVEGCYLLNFYKKHKFHKRYRLVDKKDFSNVFSAATIKIHQPNLLLLAVDNNLNHGRLGLVIAKKHCKTAVGRNRIKRQIREIFRQNIANLANVDMIFIAKSGIDKLNKPTLALVIKKILEQIKHI